MKGAIDDEGKEINPIMFPRLHIKDVEKGRPKAPPRNKMALYDKLTIPYQTFHSASGSPSFFPLPLRNCSSRPSSSRHVSSSHSTQFSTSGAPTFLTEKIRVYHSGVFNFKKMTYLFQPDDIIHCENSLKQFDGEDALEFRDSSHGRNSFYSINQNNNDEDKLKSQKSFTKVNINCSVELKSDQYGKNQIEEHREVSQIFQKPMDLRDLEAMKVGGHAFFKEEIRNVSGNSSKTLQGTNCQIHEDNATPGDKINLHDGFSGKCFQGKRDRDKGADIYRHYDSLNKAISDSTLGREISPDDVLKVIGVKKFWKARSTIINQRRVFLVQVFELHRLIQVQRLIARSHHLLLEDNLLLTKPSLEVSALKKLQSETIAEHPSSIAKLNSKFMKPAAEHAENNAAGKIPLLSVNNTSKRPIIQLSNCGHHSGNQWLVPIISPSEGLVYKPLLGPCPPNAGFMASGCVPISLNPGNNSASDEAHAVPASHQGIGFLSGTPLLQWFPPCDMQIMHPSVSASPVEQMNPFANMQSKGPENHKSDGYTMLYQSSCNMSNRMSQVMNNLKHVANYYSSNDLQLQSSTAGNPSKRKNEDALSVIPLASSSADQNSQVAGHQPRPRVIKAKPHNPKSASESAARIFRSIQEERKHL